MTLCRLRAAAWLALVMTYVLGVGIVYFIVQSTRKAWDYAVTISIWHLIISCIVMQSFPTGWVWWVSTVLGTIVMGVLDVSSPNMFSNVRMQGGSKPIFHLEAFVAKFMAVYKKRAMAGPR